MEAEKGSESLGIESVNLDLLNIVNGPDNSLFAFLSCCTLGALFSEDYSPIDPNWAKNELQWQSYVSLIKMPILDIKKPCTRVNGI